MTAVMSPTSSPATSPPALSSPASNPNHPPLPPLITSPLSRRSTLPRPMSHASKNRLSQYSTGSIASRSRPPSHIFPIFHSSLPYTLVRDFAYPAGHPMHYGPPPEPSRPPSGLTTPASESQRRLSDPPASWEARLSWETGSWSLEKGIDLPPIQFADGPPWSEDEDLQSPVVSSRHRKHKSSGAAFGHTRARPSREAAQGVLNPVNFDQERGYYVSTSGDGSERYYVNQGEEADGPGGEYVTYPVEQARHSTAAYQLAGAHARYGDPEGDYRSESDDSVGSSPEFYEQDQSRYSRDYQFTITSPDEEMHGKAVALFDFERENENELPLVEGQIIWVSYRHGQGWLVAMDPKTQESGLVPEEYVRLLRDIEGGMTSLTGQLEPYPASPNDAGTPTQADLANFNYAAASSSSNNNSSSGGNNNNNDDDNNNYGNGGNGNGNGNGNGHVSNGSNGNNGNVAAAAAAAVPAANGYHQPVVSTFSTSSKDLDPYPQHLLGTQAGQAPPQVVHYHGQRGGSQANTPTLSTHQEVGMMRRGSAQDGAGKKFDSGTVLETLPDAKLEAAGAGGDAGGKERGEQS